MDQLNCLLKEANEKEEVEMVNVKPYTKKEAAKELLRLDVKADRFKLTRIVGRLLATIGSKEIGAAQKEIDKEEADHRKEVEKHRVENEKARKAEEKKAANEKKKAEKKAKKDKPDE